MSRRLKQDQSELPLALTALKSLLKAKGLLYRDIAEQLGLSETTVKRYLTGQSLTFEILERLCRIVGVRVSDLMAMAQEEPEQPVLTQEEEAFLSKDAFLSGLFYLLSRGYTPAIVQRDFKLTDAELNGYLTALDRMGLIQLFPYNRVRVLVGPNFNVQKGGALMRLAHDAMLKDFFSSFDVGMPDWLFGYGKLSPSSLERVRELARDFIQAFDKIAETDRELTLDMAAWHSFFFILRPVDLAALKDWSPA
ncbi:MAG TPA: helix-turn-helix transcriptional regulator [Alphaproteobacteria bacterium]|jgi:transcriptional regulator with XRE-family HTH domain|nr:helix-turn-helix transcriptional regulator [Alphaproteobacteria bacterium]